MRRKVSPDGLWTWIVLKTNDIDRWNLSSLQREDREYVESLLRQVASRISTDGDIQRLEKILNEVSGDAFEVLERLAMLF
jgi:hypothetical protein